MPVGVSSKSSFREPWSPNRWVNCVPLMVWWRNAVWIGSMAFSWICSQLHSATVPRLMFRYAVNTTSSPTRLSYSGKLGLQFGRSHVGEDQATVFVCWIPGLPHVFLALAFRRFGRLLEAAAFDVEEPAVIAAANSFGFNLGVLHRRAAMAQCLSIRPVRPLPSRIPQGSRRGYECSWAGLAIPRTGRTAASSVATTHPWGCRIQRASIRRSLGGRRAIRP